MGRAFGRYRAAITPSPAGYRMTGFRLGCRTPHPKWLAIEELLAWRSDGAAARTGRPGCAPDPAVGGTLAIGRLGRYRASFRAAATPLSDAVQIRLSDGVRPAPLGVSGR
jgi:hypothetical protein